MTSPDLSRSAEPRPADYGDNSGPPAMNEKDGWVWDPDFQDWLNDLLENAPDCWDGDEWMGELATQYVRHLEAEVKRLGGSPCQDHCDAHNDAPPSPDQGDQSDREQAE